MRKPLSPRQKQIFDYIAEYIAENKFPPSLDEIADNLLLSNSTVNSHLTAMLKKGYLSRRERIPRSLRLIYADGTVNEGKIIDKQRVNNNPSGRG